MRVCRFMFRFIGLAVLTMSFFFPTNHLEAQVLQPAIGMAFTDFAAIKIVPWVNVGYQTMGLNLNFPIPDAALPDPSKFDVHPLDLKLKDSNMWIGSAGLSVQLANFWFSAHASGNVPRDVTVSTDRFIQTPFQMKGKGNVVSWRGSKLEWWEADGWAGYGFFNAATIGAGVRWSKTSVSLIDPEGPFGSSGGATPALILDYNGDLSAKLVIPYFAIQSGGSNYTFMLAYSPFVYADVTVPLSLITSVSGGTQNRFEDGIYTLQRGGNFLEGSFEYDVNMLRPVDFQLWAKGSLVRITGDGDYQLTGNRENIKKRLINASWSGSGSETSTFNTYLLSGGISATIPF